MSTYRISFLNSEIPIQSSSKDSCCLSYASFGLTQQAADIIQFYNQNNQMSVNHEHGDKDMDQSTFALTISSISFQQSEHNNHYDQEFTLNPISTSPEPKDRNNCLAYQLAQTFPLRIRQQVTKMVIYYENTLENQAKQFHRIVQENHKLKKDNNKLRAINMSNEYSGLFLTDKKENISPFRKGRVHKNSEQHISPSKNILQSRVSELENLVLNKDTKINELNGEISELMLKLRRYKKKIEESVNN